MNESNVCQVSVADYAALEFEHVPVITSQVQAVAVLLIYAVALVLDLLLGMIVSFTKKLWIRPFILSLQIPIINVLQTVALGPIVFVTAMFQTWKFGKYGCYASAIVLNMLRTCRWLTMFTITLDRFLSVSSPFNYPKIANLAVTVLSLVFWVVSLLLSIPPLFNFGCYIFFVEEMTCALDWVCPNIYCYLFYVAATGFIFLLGGVVPVCMYVMMLRRAWKFSRANTLGQLDGEQIHVRQQHLTQRDVRAIITFFVLFVTLIGLTLPFYVNILLKASLGMTYQPPIGVDFLLSDIFYLLPIADAFILAWNRDIKEAIRKTVKKCTSSSRT